MNPTSGEGSLEQVWVLWAGLLMLHYPSLCIEIVKGQDHQMIKINPILAKAIPIEFQTLTVMLTFS